jgi:hypothetical protein
VFLALFLSDFAHRFEFLDDMGRVAGTLLPEHFDAVDSVFAFITLFLIIKFVFSLRPILEN